LIYQSFLFN